MQQAIPNSTEGEVRVLANGMRVLFDVMPHVRSISAGVWIRTGSANERAEQAGISHFLEHLFFKGTTTKTARELMVAIEGRGGSMNAFTTRDYTCVYARTLDSQTQTAIEILGDVLRDSQFFDFEKERSVILEEIASIEDVPEDYAHDLLMERVWPNHALGRSVSGYDDTVSALTIEQVRAYFEAWYRPENMLFTLAGRFDPDEAFQWVRAQFEDLPATPAPETYAPPLFGGGLDTEVRDIAQSHYCLAFPGPSATDPQRYVYEMLTNALGGGSTSRLFERIREQEGLAYSIYAFRSSYRPCGLVGLYAAVAPETLRHAIDITCEELRKLRETPMSEHELELNREQLKGGFLLSLESSFNRMSRLAKSMMHHGRILSIDEIIAGVDAVASDEVMRLAQAIFTASSCAGIILGPESQSVEVAL